MPRRLLVLAIALAGVVPMPAWVAAVRPSSADSAAQVVPGDVLTVNARSALGAVVSVPTSIPPYFVTSPALAAYTVGAGAPTSVDYPVGDATPGTGMGNPIVLDSSGMLTVRLAARPPARCRVSWD